MIRGDERRITLGELVNGMRRLMVRHALTPAEVAEEVDLLAKWAADTGATGYSFAVEGLRLPETTSAEAEAWVRENPGAFATIIDEYGHERYLDERLAGNAHA